MNPGTLIFFFFKKKKQQQGLTAMGQQILILIDSVFKKDESYHLQFFLKECKYIEKKVIRYITDDSNFSSDFSIESDED